ncbi:hypothetical protein FXO38_12850 [Capsicum annuum]|nr:hypothetical protein FXO38_12850 [Capsicum annuum]KAF3681462.1 hypothetical protein FXO37_02903 [Capsicum annuum]
MKHVLIHQMTLELHLILPSWDSLIDQPEYVKELRSKGILLNFLGSDQEVADLFNDIARDLVPNPHAYVDVKDKIEKHYNNKGKIWIAEWKNTHFNTPWTVFAFIAALFVICLQVTSTFLAGVQTYYAAHPKGLTSPLLTSLSGTHRG